MKTLGNLILSLLIDASIICRFCIKMNTYLEISLPLSSAFPSSSVLENAASGRGNRLVILDVVREKAWVIKDFS